MSWDPGDEPPIIAPPVRRDPNISIHRTDDPEAMGYVREQMGPPPRKRAGARDIWKPIVVALVVLAIPIFAGFLAHAVERAILLGWRLA